MKQKKGRQDLLNFKFNLRSSQFDSWWRNEPNDHQNKQDCVKMWKTVDYNWNDDDCNSRRGVRFRKKLIHVSFIKYYKWLLCLPVSAYRIEYIRLFILL